MKYTPKLRRLKGRAMADSKRGASHLGFDAKFREPPDKALVNVDPDDLDDWPDVPAPWEFDK